MREDANGLSNIAFLSFSKLRAKKKMIGHRSVAHRVRRRGGGK